MAASSGSGWPLFLVVTAAAATADVLSKDWVFRVHGMPAESAPFPIVPPLLVLEPHLNEGALFGVGQGMGALFATVSVAAIVGILTLVARPSTRADRWVLVALGLIVGGIAGNLYDRLGLPGLRWHAPAGRIGEPVLAVRDWIHFQIPGVLDWPIFNLADSWLVIGAGMLLLSSFSSRGPAETEPPAQP
ncbi:MAG: signal peptidase II [Planctomycetaceae bacterium]